MEAMDLMDGDTYVPGVSVVSSTGGRGKYYSAYRQWKILVSGAKRVSFPDPCVCCHGDWKKPARRTWDITTKFNILLGSNKMPGERCILRARGQGLTGVINP